MLRTFTLLQILNYISTLEKFFLYSIHPNRNTYVSTFFGRNFFPLHSLYYKRIIEKETQTIPNKQGKRFSKEQTTDTEFPPSLSLGTRRRTELISGRNPLPRVYWLYGIIRWGNLRVNSSGSFNGLMPGQTFPSRRVRCRSTVETLVGFSLALLRTPINAINTSLSLCMEIYWWNDRSAIRDSDESWFASHNRIIAKLWVLNSWLRYRFRLFFNKTLTL